MDCFIWQERKVAKIGAKYRNDVKIQPRNVDRLRSSDSSYNVARKREPAIRFQPIVRFLNAIEG